MSASEASREDRHLPASERRIQKAREEGQIPRSRDLVHLAVLAAFCGLAALAGPMLAEQGIALVSSGLALDRATATDPQRVFGHLSQVLGNAWMLGLALPAALALCIVMASVAVGGWNVSSKALVPDWSRLDPVAGLGRLLQRRHLLNHARVAAVAAALLGVAIWYVWRHAQHLIGLQRLPVETALSTAFDWSQGGVLVLIGVAAFWAVVDVPLQWFNHRAELRMTLEEVKEEHKESEGDPHLKSERRRRQRAVSRSRMMAAIPSANVVVVNPTHYAVALRYDEATMQAPRIVAMGADHLARKIREIAKDSRVPVLDAPPLARALYRHGKLDEEIPFELYKAVAQVLAYVNRLRHSLHVPPAPQIAVPPGLDPLEAEAS